MLGGPTRTSHLAEVGAEGTTGQGDGMRHVRREPGQGNLAGWRMDLPSQRDQPSTAQDLQAIRHDQRHGGGGLLYPQT